MWWDLQKFVKKNILFKDMLRKGWDISKRKVLRNGWEGVYFSLPFSVIFNYLPELFASCLCTN